MKTHSFLNIVLGVFFALTVRAAQAPISAPRDAPYPGGTIRLNVDATDIERRIFRVREDAIHEAHQSGGSIQLLVRNDDRYRTVTMDYHDGLRYPHLERTPNVPARLDQILAPRL